MPAGKRLAEIATNATTRQFLTKANGQWSARQVVATLRNPVYVGRFKDENDVRPGCHQPIIGIDVFHAVGHILDSRRTAGPKRTSYGDVWLLKGKIHCRRCGRLLTSHSCRHGVIVYRYYCCRATGGGRPPCGYPNHRQERHHYHYRSLLPPYQRWQRSARSVLTRLNPLINYLATCSSTRQAIPFWKS